MDIPITPTKSLRLLAGTPERRARRTADGILVSEAGVYHFSPVVMARAMRAAGLSHDKAAEVVGALVSEAVRIEREGV